MHSPSSTFNVRRVLLIVLVWLWAAGVVPAQAPQPLLHCVFPAGGQRGRTLEVTANGVQLQGADTVRISGPGVTAKIIDASKPDVVRLLVTIALTAPVGERDIRLRTPGGVTNRYRFMVGDLPESQETEPNSELGQAQRLEGLPVLINGRLTEPDRDYFRFAAKAGQTLVAALQGRPLLPFIPDAVPGWIDGCLTLYDAAGNELQMVDDFRLHPDPVLIYTLPKDGEYVLELRDVLYRGRHTFVYRLSVGMLPYVTHCFPLGGQRNTAVGLQMWGVNLPTAWTSLWLPADSPPLRSVGPGGYPSGTCALPFAVSDLPEAQEAEPNESREQANRIEVPSIINGRIDRSGDNDYYVFAAQAQQHLVMEIQARRLGAPLDALLYLYNAQGGEITRNDEWVDPLDPLLTHHADSRIVYTFPAAGDYLLRVQDIQQNGGEEFAYRLMVAPPRQNFVLRVTPDNPRLTKGDTAVLTVKAIRLDGFAGEIALAAQNLPAGFLVSEAMIPAGQEQTRMTITAPADAAPGLLVPQIVGKAQLGNTPVTRTATGAETLMQAFTIMHLVPTQELALAVIEPALLTLSTASPPTKIVEVHPATETQVVVKAIRHGGAKGEVKLALDGPPAGITLKAPAVIPADKDEASLVLVIGKDAPVNILHGLLVSGTLNTGKESATRFAPAVPLKVVPAK